jgi:hypothetical protein
MFGICAVQWLQISIGVFYCDLYGLTLIRAFQAPNIELATWLSLGGLCTQALGMRLALGRWILAPDRMKKESANLDIGKLFLAWIVLFFIGSAVAAVAWKLGGVRQFVMPFASLKWVLFFMLGYRVITHGEGQGMLVAAMCLEFVVGLVGYFSTFKEVLLMFIIVVMSLGKRLSFKVNFMVACVVALGLMTSVFWSAIKQDFRNELHSRWDRRGSNTDFSARFALMQRRLESFDSKMFDEGVLALVARVHYTSLLGQVIQYVPSVVPHENGKLWQSAFMHVLMPRFLFPNKAVLDDSALAAKYTGIRLAGMDDRTSIGIGYYSESYVDFGPIGMMAPTLVMGLLFGAIFRFFTLRSTSRLMGVAIATTILYPVVTGYATAAAKIFGGTIMTCIIFFLLSFFWKQLAQWVDRDDRFQALARRATQARQ